MNIVRKVLDDIIGKLPSKPIWGRVYGHDINMTEVFIPYDKDDFLSLDSQPQKGGGKVEEIKTKIMTQIMNKASKIQNMMKEEHN